MNAFHHLQHLVIRALDMLYDDVYQKLCTELYRYISQSPGALVFDGWEDVNGKPIINILLRTESIDTSKSTIYFLKTVYPADKSLNAMEYKSQVDDVLTEFGIADKICAITTETTSSCRNARKLCQEHHKNVVSVNDQPHIIDLAMQDIGKIKWISSVISKVCKVNSTVHRYSKLKARFEHVQSKCNDIFDKHSKLHKQKQISISDFHMEGLHL